MKRCSGSLIWCQVDKAHSGHLHVLCWPHAGNSDWRWENQSKPCTSSQTYNHVLTINLYPANHWFLN